MKILTIITPTFNLVKAGRIEAFRQCVESVHEQSCLEKIEHIVVDGESTDGTTAILDEYRGRGYFNVVSKKDHSVYEGMNNGLAVATGKYVLFLNSDDFFHGKTGLGRALDEVEKAGVDYAFGDVHVVTLDGSYRRTWVGSTDGLPFATHYCHQSMLVKASVLRGYGGFQLKYKVSSDSDLMLRLYRDQKTYIHYKDAFASYREGGVSCQDEQRAIRDHATAFMEYFGKDLGLTFEECCSIWCLKGLRHLSWQERGLIAKRLAKPNWRQEWKRAVREHSWFTRLLARLKTDGINGLVAAVARRFRRSLGMKLKEL